MAAVLFPMLVIWTDLPDLFQVAHDFLMDQDASPVAPTTQYEPRPTTP